MEDVDSRLDRDLGFTLGVVFRSYLKAANLVLEDLPGGARGYQVLAAAAHGMTCGQGVLAQRLGIDKTVMTYLVDDLERAGLLARTPDPTDRRNKRLTATEEGRVAHDRIAERLRHAEDHVLAPLDATDRATLRDLLCRLAVRAQSADPVHDACELTELS